MPPGTALHDPEIRVRVRLLVGAEAPVPLRVGHGDADGEVLLLGLVQVVDETRVVVGTVLGVDAVGDLEDRVEAVHGEVAHRAPGLLADGARVFELREEVGGGAVDVEEAVDGGAARVLGGGRDRAELLRPRIIVGDPHRVDAGGEARVVGHALDPAPLHEDARPVRPQRLPVVRRRHQHRSTSPRSSPLPVDPRRARDRPERARWYQPPARPSRAEPCPTSGEPEGVWVGIIGG